MDLKTFVLAHLPEIASALLLLVLIVLLNVWAFAPPKSQLGYFVLNVLTRFTITAYDRWGFKGLRSPFTSADIPPPPKAEAPAPASDGKLPPTPPEERS